MRNYSEKGEANMILQKDLDEFKAVFGSRLSALIRDRNCTQRAVADTVGVTQQLVSRWVGKKYRTVPNAVQLARIARYLETTTDYLAGLSDIPAIPRKKPRK